MENTGVVGSVKGCVGSGMFFGFNHGSTLCHNIVIERGIPTMRSNDDIIFINSCQMSIVSIYGSVITLEYSDHNNE